MNIASELPTHLEVIATMAKPVLKRLMARSFPANWVYRQKDGFPTHTTRWLADKDVELNHESIWTSVGLEIFSRQFIGGPGGPS